MQNARILAIDRLEPEDRHDFVLVVVRKNQVADLLPVLAQNQSPNIVYMGNNLSGPQEFTSILDPQRSLLHSRLGEVGMAAPNIRQIPGASQ